MPQTPELLRDVRINGEDLRLADVLRWEQKQRPEDDVFLDDPDDTEQACDGRLLVGYLLHRAALDRVGRGGQVVNQRTNTWSRDGRNEDIEVTVGRPADPRSGATWTDCKSYWFHRRADEIERAAKALDVYRRYRKAEDRLYTERVEVDYAAPGGGAGIETRRFWIAYEPHIAGYADDDYRISHASGSGATKQEALLAAIGAGIKG
jgi:hypothetical protein